MRKMTKGEQEIAHDLDELFGDAVCRKCHYVWKPRKKNPRQCPFCKSMKWYEKTKNYAKGN